jgi:hypothetical protein
MSMTGSVPPIRYAKAGDVDIVYRVVGDGPVDLVWVPGLFSNLVPGDWQLYSVTSS